MYLNSNFKDDRVMAPRHFFSVSGESKVRCFGTLNPASERVAMLNISPIHTTGDTYLPKYIQWIVLTNSHLVWRLTNG